MRRYGGNKGYGYGERRSLASLARISPSCSYLLIGLLYCLSISIYGSPIADQTRMREDISQSVLSPERYPLPSDQVSCGNNYLKLNFVCDPDILLSHTEAIIINTTLGKKFFHCFSSYSSDELSSLFKHSAQPGTMDMGRPNHPMPSHNQHSGAPHEETPRNDGDYLANGPPTHRHTHKCIRSRFYTVGIALAKTMQEDSVGQCNGDGGSETVYSLDQQRALKLVLDKTKVLPRMARKIRTLWEKGRGCRTDILILIVQSVVFCHEGSTAVFSGVEPLMGLSFSKRVQNLLAETTASNLEQSRRRWTSADTSDKRKHKFAIPAASSCQNKNCVINMIKRMMQLLDDGLPQLTGSDHSEWEQEDDQEPISTEQDDTVQTRQVNKGKPGEQIWFSYPKHTIPAWALIAFGVSLCVALGCAYLGHWVNTGRSRLHATSEASSAKYHIHNRRWRAGFGGGMLELHNNAQPKGAGGQGSGFGQPSRTRGGLPQGAVRAKMFGGLGMGPASARMRQANGPQHSYHRV